MSGPLSGLRVLDIATVFAGPFAAALLGDMGADVLKVEMPGVGDPLRALGPFKGETSLTWAASARNKRSMTLDLQSPQGQEVLLRLLADQDVLIENFRPGTLDRWGLGAERLREANPDLIIVRVSGYGQTGPNKGKAGFGTPATAYSGYAHISGFPDRPPVLPSVSLVDYLTGMYAAMGALAAIYQLKVTGGPVEEVDVALYESIFRMLEVVVAEYAVLGTVRQRTGNELAASSPAGIYESKDGQWMVIVTSTERTFARLAAAMDREDLLTDPRYCTNRARLERREEMNQMLADWAGQRTRSELETRLDDFSVPHSVVYSAEDIFADEHYAAREMLVEVAHPQLGTVTLPGVVPKFSRNPGAVRNAGPALGEHTDDVLTGLGMTPEEITGLREEGII
ncbi:MULTISPECIES: CaiB/BaiF CoA transferase family protein [unclassified Modestobacter]|uniref:CaiB/BaiF CoA transferase family protein n=1 Tax=unclassified Modestobacter TaxID=2643866 RepID=UPI0022AA03F2|nr:MULTISPECIES: CoA transferase [unclassified Modestobacter]MCZ2826102.1 CoA transferase [Modestobacter sp. VKM Ac-2981]MCZ2852833.1 CoA transferase [Modestobacter sp. VKM Ac-2982]